MVRLGIESQASCSASKNLTTTPSLFQSAWQHNSIGVNHACQVSGFWGESPDSLKMTTDDGLANWEFTKSPPRDEWKGEPPPLEVQQFHMYAKPNLAPVNFFILSVWCWFSYGTLINSNNVIIWDTMSFKSVRYLYTSVVKPGAEKWGGATKRMKRKSCIESGVWGPPPEFFYRKRYKIWQFYAFLDTSNDIYQRCHHKRVDGIYVICIIW